MTGLSPASSVSVGCPPIGPVGKLSFCGLSTCSDDDSVLSGGKPPSKVQEKQLPRLTAKQL